MLTVETRHAVDPATARAFDTEALRRHFQVAGIFRPGEIRLIYTHYDRMIIGGAVPAGAPLTLDRVAEAGTPGVLDRREMVVVNIGGDGEVSAAGTTHRMTKGDMLYFGMGSGPVTFSGISRFACIVPISVHLSGVLMRIVDGSYGSCIVAALAAMAP